ncbi:MAG: serine/threonine-protein kinase [Planctomycetota bacterium]|nr:serine/threonine-protein kinase [Planctomycetota bacterium]
MTGPRNPDEESTAVNPADLMETYRYNKVDDGLGTLRDNKDLIPDNADEETAVPAKAPNQSDLKTQGQFTEAYEDTSDDTVVAKPKQPKPECLPEGLKNVYREIDMLGQGGMGSVFLCEDLKTREQVVLKILRPMNKSDTSWTRFQREAAALSLLNHPNIVKLRDFGTLWENQSDGSTLGHPYLVMDHARGRSLFDVVEDSIEKTGKPPSWEWLVLRFYEIAKALGVCHHAGLIHRDIKPGNIVIDEVDDCAKLIDFGLVKVNKESFQEGLSPHIDSITRTGQVIGTPVYMPPEQLFGRKEDMTPSVDVWALGATFFYALTGRLPYNMANNSELAKAIKQADPKPLSLYLPGAPTWLDALLASCLSRTISDRPKIHHVAAILHRESRSSSYQIIAIIVVFLLTMIGTTYLLLPILTQKQPNNAIEIYPHKAVTSKTFVNLTGHVRMPGVRNIYIRRKGAKGEAQRHQLKPDGTFLSVQDLSDGKNTWILEVKDGVTGKARSTREITVTRKPK